MENVVTIIFEDENESYRAFSELKSDLVSLPCIIAQIVLLKKQDGRLIVRDGAGIDAYGDTRRGGLLGLFVGILGGPIGVLLGGAVGSMIGMAMDMSEARKKLSLIKQVSFDLAQEAEVRADNTEQAIFEKIEKAVASSATPPADRLKNAESNFGTITGKIDQEAKDRWLAKAIVQDGKYYIQPYYNDKWRDTYPNWHPNYYAINKDLTRTRIGLEVAYELYATGKVAGEISDTALKIIKKAVRKKLSLIEQMSFDLSDGYSAIIALAQETDEKALNARLSPYKVEIIRREAADVAAEIDQALKVQKELEEEARHRLHLKKEAEFKNLIQQKREELKSDFESLKEKLKKDL